MNNPYLSGQEVVIQLKELFWIPTNYPGQARYKPAGMTEFEGNKSRQAKFVMSETYPE